jgi:hypothetical protein
MTKINPKLIFATSLIALAAAGCAGSKGSTNAGPGTYALTVTSVNPASGLALTVSPADVNSAGASGAPTPETDLSLIYNTGTAVTLTAPTTTSAGSAFVAWVGCDSVSGYVCKVTMSASKSVEVEYTGVSSISINPQTITLAAGGGVQVPFTVNGYGTCTSPMLPTQPCEGSAIAQPTLYLPAGVTGSLGTISATGYYTPASSSPASSVNVTIQSAFAPNVTAVGLINLQQ